MITFQNGSKANVVDNSLLSFAHTTSGANRLLVVLAHGGRILAGSAGTLAVKFAGVSMTQVASVVFASNLKRVALFYLTRPASSGQVVIESSAVMNNLVGVACTYTGANQDHPLGVSKTNSGTSNTPNIVGGLSSTSDQVVISGVSSFDADVGSTLTATAPLAKRFESINAPAIPSLGIGDRVGAAAAATSWTVGGLGVFWGLVSAAFWNAAAVFPDQELAKVPKERRRFLVEEE